MWYNIADALVLASYQEAFGAVTNEALLAGCYALVSNKAGSACLVEEGVNGYTFSPMDVEELAQKMEKISALLSGKEEFVLKENMMQISYSDYICDIIKTINNL